jgi:hypothetical protein
MCCRECGTPFVDPSIETNPQGPAPAKADALGSTSPGPVLGMQPRWLVCFLGLVVLTIIVARLMSQAGRKADMPRIVVLATSSSNGEQLVTFRPEPPTAAITYVDLVSASADGNTQPPTIRSFGRVFPIRNAWETNHSLRYVALPMRTLAVPGRPLAAYTPGSYTVAYAPTENGYRVRAGVALERKGAGDYLERLLECWRQRSLARLWMRSHRDPLFVIIEPLANAAAGTQ